jgi:hypothetical protein
VQGDWLDVVAPHIQARIAKYSANEIRFNLMAVVADRQEQISKQLAAAKARRAAAAAKLGLSDGGDAPMETDEAGSSAAQPLPDDVPALQHVLAQSESDMVRCVAGRSGLLLGACSWLTARQQVGGVLARGM